MSTWKCQHPTWLIKILCQFWTRVLNGMFVLFNVATSTAMCSKREWGEVSNRSKCHSCVRKGLFDSGELLLNGFQLNRSFGRKSVDSSPNSMLPLYIHMWASANNTSSVLLSVDGFNCTVNGCGGLDNIQQKHWLLCIFQTHSKRLSALFISGARVFIFLQNQFPRMSWPWT